MDGSDGHRRLVDESNGAHQLVDGSNGRRRLVDGSDGGHQLVFENISTLSQLVCQKPRCELESCIEFLTRLIFGREKKKKVSKKKLSNLRTVTNQTTLFCCYSRLCTRPHAHTCTIPGSVLSISRHGVDFCSFCSNLTLDQCPFDSVPKFTASHSQVQHPGSAEPCLILILNE